jgi:protein TonB
MGRDNKYFYISGFLSLSLFFFFFALFLFMLFRSSHIKSFAMNKDNYISVSIDIQKVPTKKMKKQTPSATPVATASVTPTQDVDVNDLFSDVWTKKIPKHKPKAQNKRRVEQLRKKIKLTKENSVESLTPKINELDSKKSDDANQASSTAEEVNEYLAKIQAIVYRYFHVPQNSQGHSVRVVIELSALGKMTDFRILNYSANESLNKEADKIKNRLRGVIFPINPQNISSRTIVILKSKE